MTLAVDGRYVTETTLEVLATTEAVAVRSKLRSSSFNPRGQPVNPRTLGSVRTEKEE